jgi:hypothetical protein
MVMSTEGDRRAPGATRVPFDAVVEVGGALGPSFEAQAIDISEEGMHLRTAYLPVIGQPLTCRFEVGSDSTILAAGEVIWAEEMGRGGEFGIRFTNLDPQSAEALGRIIGMGYAAPMQQPGSKVRLHIEGLGSPMRARVKDMSGASVTAFSELGFLQVGKQLELEDASTGHRRPAVIDRVEVEVDPSSRVPQLVVALKYDDEMARMESAAMAAAPPKETTPGPSTIDEDVPVDEAPPAMAQEAAAPEQEPHEAAHEESAEDAGSKMKGAIARGAAKVGPALTNGLGKIWNRARVTMALIAAKRGGGSADDVGIPIRRVTSPPPGGGLHTAGRKVIRGEIAAEEPEEKEEQVGFLKRHKRKIALGGTIGVAMLLTAIALKKPAAPPPLANTPPVENTATTAAAAATNAAPITMPAATINASGPLAGDPGMTGLPTGPAPTSMMSDTSMPGDKHGKHGKVTPFGNGNVAHGNLLHIKMDGPIDKINGAPTPTGFNVTVPGRRSLEAAGPLAQRDARIASLRVSNEASGAELNMTFKDGVPTYQVRAKGDTLEIALAPIGGEKPEHHSPSANKKKHGKR